MESSDSRSRKSQTKYWDVDRTLSHNCLFNFIISLRGGGKTYGCLKRVIKNFLDAKNREGFDSSST